MGFKGTWNPSALKSMMSKLADTRRSGKEVPVMLAGREFMVKPTGTGGGFAHYEYIIEALYANDLFTFHKVIRWLLREFGFEIGSERVIRAELQVMILRHVSEYLDLIYGGV